jgi:PncC family amidohydrolase
VLGVGLAVVDLLCSPGQAGELSMQPRLVALGGMVSSALAEAPGSGEWFCGALVAFTSELKHELLHVPAGPVVTANAAAVMAGEVRRLLGADVAVSLTGAAGPDGQDGQPPGRLFLGLSGKLSVLGVELQRRESGHLSTTRAVANGWAPNW